MHIVDATLFFAPRSGGVKRYLLAKQKILAGLLGVRHTLLVPGATDGGSGAGIVEVRGLRLPFAGGYRVPLRPGAWRRALCALEPDLIEVGDPYHLAWASLAAAERLGVPVTAFAHSDLSRLLGSRCGALASAGADAYLRRLYARFDAVLAPSRAVAAHLQSIGIQRVVVQPLGVDGAVFHPSAHDPGLRAELGLPAHTRLLVFAGRMAAEKRIPLMCRAVEGLGPPYHLLLVGGGERRRLSPHVTALPYQHDPCELARLLASTDALLHAGHQETFGLVILEAMACGRPVVGVGSGAVAELVGADVGCLAETESVASLQQAIRALYAADRARMGICARAHAELHYTWERTLAAQIGLYSRLTQHLEVGVPLIANYAPR